MITEEYRHTLGPVGLEFLARLQLALGGTPLPEALNEIRFVCSPVREAVDSTMN